MKFVRAPPETIPDDPADFESNSELEIQLGVCLQLLHLGSGSAYQKHYISYQGAKWDPFVNGNEIPTMNENKQNRTGMQMGIKTKQFFENRTNCNEECLLMVESLQDGRGG